MSDYYECPECGSNNFQLEWGRIQCENGHGVLDGWPSASKRIGMDTLHDLALALDLLRDLEWSGMEDDIEYCPFCNQGKNWSYGHTKDCRLAAIIGGRVKP